MTEKAINELEETDGNGISIPNNNQTEVIKSFKPIFSVPVSTPRARHFLPYPVYPRILAQGLHYAIIYSARTFNYLLWSSPSFIYQYIHHTNHGNWYVNRIVSL